MMRSRILLVTCLVSAGAPGCAGAVKNMRAVDRVDTTPAPNEAVVVFLRPSGAGFGVQSAVFELEESGPATLVGIVAAKKKLAHRTTPGRHTYMVIGESADFMAADLQPGRVYYAVVQVRMGVWKARFSLNPVHVTGRGELGGWLADAQWVATTQDSFAWARDNAADVEQKRAEYWPKWMAKLPLDRPVLFPDDGY
jgi:hypothetical protein